MAKQKAINKQICGKTHGVTYWLFLPWVFLCEFVWMGIKLMFSLAFFWIAIPTYLARHKRVKQLKQATVDPTIAMTISENDIHKLRTVRK